MDNCGVERVGIGNAGVHHHLFQLLIHPTDFLDDPILTLLQQRREDATPHGHSVGTEGQSLVSVIATVNATVDEDGDTTSRKGSLISGRMKRRRDTERYTAMMVGDYDCLAARIFSLHCVSNGEYSLAINGKGVDSAYRLRSQLVTVASGCPSTMSK